jgi:hypothetical protein
MGGGWGRSGERGVRDTRRHRGVNRGRRKKQKKKQKKNYRINGF